MNSGGGAPNDQREGKQPATSGNKKKKDEEFDAKFEEFMKQPLSSSSQSTALESAEIGKEEENETEKKKKRLWWLKEEETKKTKTTFLKAAPKSGEKRSENEQENKNETGSGNASKPETTKLTSSTTNDKMAGGMDEETDNVPTLTETSETDGVGFGLSMYSEDFDEEEESGEIKMTETENEDSDRTAIGSPSIEPPLGKDLSLSKEEPESDRQTVEYEASEAEERPPSALNIIGEFNVRSVDEILREAEELEKSISKLDGGEGRRRVAVQGVRLENEIRLESERTTAAAVPFLPFDKEHSAPEVSDLRQHLREEKMRNEKLSSDVQKQKMDFEERMFRLEEQNMQLKAKLEGIAKDETESRPCATVEKEKKEEEDRQMERFARQAREQERILVGYQKENERLYKEVKEMKNNVKEMKEKAEEENQNLRRELVRTKEDLHYKEVLLKSREDRNGKDDDLLKSTRKQLESEKIANERLTKKLSQTEESDEATNLKRRIVALEREVRDKNVENKSLSGVVKTKERKVEQLQKQVKQLESLLKVRNPNSISALVLAAGVVDGTNATDGSPQIVALLEERIRDLEFQLGTKATEGSKSFEALQDQFNTIKEQYRARVEQLERQVARSEPKKLTLLQGGGVFGSHRPQTTITALETELESVRERHRREIEKMREETDALQRELKRKNAGGFKDGDRVAALNARIRSLVSECNAKEKRIQEQSRKVKAVEDYERRAVDDTDPKKVKESSGELERLRRELDASRQRAEDLQRAFRESETRLNGFISDLRSELGEVNSNLEKTTSRFLEMSRKCETQEIIIDDLKEKMSEAADRNERYTRLEAENGALKDRCRQLNEEMCHSLGDPKFGDFSTLQARVFDVERMYREKSEELRRITSGRDRVTLTTPAISTNGVHPNETAAEVNKWKRKFYARNVELEKFRSELDEIISALEEMQEGILSS